MEFGNEVEKLNENFSREFCVCVYMCTCEMESCD